MGRLYIYLHFVELMVVNVGKYTVRPMDPMSMEACDKWDISR